MSFSEWKEYKLQDILLIPLKNGVSKPSRIRGSGFKMVNMGELFANSIIGDIKMELVPMTDKELVNYLLEYEDLLFARQSLTVEGAGKCSIFVGRSVTTTYEGHLMRLRINRDIARPRYVYYYFNSPIGKNKIKTIVTSTAAAGIRGSDLNNIQIKLPSIQIQQRTISILSTLDGKIELNRQTNQTLEAIAQTVFKEMCLPKGDELEEGWRVEKLEEEIETVSETYKFGNKENIIFLNTGDISDGLFLHSDYSVVSTLPGQAKKRIRKNDILFSEIRPINKRFAFVDFDADEYVVSTKLMVLRSKRLSPIFLYFYLTREEMIKDLQHLAETRSGTFPQITFSQLKDLKIILPPQEILEAFIKILEEKFLLIKNNEKEINTLIALRETLLPKLMKGEIEINN